MPPVLENSKLRITLNPTSGDIVGLFNKQSGKEYLAEPTAARLFRLYMPLPGRVSGLFVDPSGHALNSWEQEACQIESTRTDDAFRMVITYSALKSEVSSFPVRVTVTLDLRDESDELLMQIAVKNETPHTINEVFFPWISGFREIEDVQSDVLVYPNRIVRVHDAFPVTQMGNWEEHPYLTGMQAAPPSWPNGYEMAMPWLSYGGAHEGFYLASLDRTGMRHILIVQDLSDGHPNDAPLLGIAWNFLSYITPGGVWTSPQIVVSLHTGDWRTAADKYRQTLHDWYQPAQTPRAFKRALGSFNSAFTARDFNQIADLASDIQRFGLTDLIMWYFGNYYPNVLEGDVLEGDTARLGLVSEQYGGLARLREANTHAQTMGVRTGIIFSQRLWNLATLTPELRQQADDWAIRRESGVPVVETWNHHHYGGFQWNAHFGVSEYVMCSAHPAWQQFAIKTITEVMRQCGYSTIFYDQAVEVEACFNPAHRHPEVSAPAQASLPFLRALKSEMQRIRPDAVLIGEGFELLSSQALDLGWCWTVRHKSEGAGASPNPEVMRYTLPWYPCAMPLDDDIPTANRWFVLGLHLAIVPRSLESGKKLSDFPEFAAHIAHLSQLRHDLEPFFVDGRFMDALGLECTGAFAKVYVTADQLAILVANLELAPIHAQIEVEGALYGIRGEKYRWQSSAGTVSYGSARPTEGGKLTVAHQLARSEVGAFVFERDPALATALHTGKEVNEYSESSS